MVTTVNSYKGKGVFHTIERIVGKQYGFDEQGFNAFHKGKESDYQLLERYLIQIKGLKAKRGQYGIDVHLRNGGTKTVCILTYYEEGNLVFTSNSNAINKELESIITEFTSNEWVSEVDGSEIEQLIAKHFSLSNYIKQYKTYAWVELMVKVVEQRDFYEEFIQGMDQFSKLGLLWNYTNTGLVISYEADTFTIDDSFIFLQQDRLQILGDFFTFISLIKSKYYQEDSGELLATPDTTDEQVSEGGVTGVESHTSGEELLTESRLEELQAEEESNYLDNLKKVNTDTPPTYQTDKLGVETEGLQPIKGNAFLSKLKSDLAVALIVYKDGEEIVNTLKQSKWVDGDKQYTDGIIKGVEAVIKKYSLGKVDIVFNRGTDEVKIRVGGGQPDEQQLIVQKGGSPSLDSHTILVPEQKDPVSYILNWFEVHNGW